ncbi:MAG: N-acetylglucosamine-6-phosphate deacetylase, partial [Acutalibacteraceae bacterium]
VDIHFHGCIGEDFSDADLGGLCRIAEYELSHGIAYICPAGMTLPEQQLADICKTAAEYKNEHGAELVGINLEGPFVSAEKKGAQNEKFIHAPDIDMLNRLQSAANGKIRLVTVAPECENAISFIKAATMLGVTVSVGHTNADYDTAAAAFEAGATQITHMYNAMPPFHHRNPAVIGAAFDNYNVRAELICDGVHVHPSAVRAAFKLFGADRIILISDSLRATGMPDGDYPFGGQTITLCGSRAVMKNSPDTLAGSVTNLMDCMRKAVSFGVPLADAVKAASYNPASSIGADDRIGSLDNGKEASMVLLDKSDLSVRGIIFMGARIF